MAVVKSFVYVDPKGVPLARIDRVEPGRDGKAKEFFPYLYLSESGRYSTKAGLFDEQLPLYHIDKVRKAIAKQRRVFFVEGEGKCDRLRTALVEAKLSATVTTISGGATAPLREHHVNGFEDAIYVVFLSDSDNSGRDAAKKRSQAIADAYPECIVKNIDLFPDRNDGSDIEDWLDKGHKLTELRDLVNAAPRIMPTLKLEMPPTVPTEVPTEPLCTTPQFTAEPPALAFELDILDKCARRLEDTGLVGEQQLAKLSYLSLTSRLLKKPISIVVKGPSAAGKSYTIERVLRFFPKSAYYQLTGMSERVLVYDVEEDLEHRMIIIFEAAGMSGDMASYFMRTLLSEGKLIYKTNEKTKSGSIKTKTLERKGPTGLITTTTSLHLHPENETRLLSLLANDTPAQTSAIMNALAEKTETGEGGDFGEGTDDFTEWHALQEYLAQAKRDVIIPYATKITSQIPPKAIRLRRDTSILFSLIMTHAILHQATRYTSDDGKKIIAAIDDYTVVYNLVRDLMSHGVEASVPATVRQTVVAVAEAITPANGGTVTISSMAHKLKLDRSVISRRMMAAADKGFLKTLEDNRGGHGKAKHYTLDEALPEDEEILPSPETVQKLCKEAGIVLHDVRSLDTAILGNRATVQAPSRAVSGGCDTADVTEGIATEVLDEADFEELED